MRRNLSITTAAAALLVGTVFAAAQGVQRPGGGAEPGGAQGGTQMAPQQDGGKGKAKTQQQQQPRTQGQGGSQTPGRQGQAAPEGKGKAQSKEPRTQGQGGQGQPQQQGQQPKQQPQQGQQTPRDTQKTQKGAEGKGGAQTGGVTLTQQQRTTIRTTVLQGGKAPRVNNVNFSISVGTVVPRDRVRLVAVPPTLVEIRPAWRGYLYFVVGERIIIVEPRSYKIVAVLVV
jgi:hypothetical protein